jgi:Flagellar biosynthesis protein, FliO
MTLKLSIQRSSKQTIPKKPGPAPVAMYGASSAQQFPATFADCFGKLGMTAIRQQQVQEISAPKASQPAATLRSLVTRAVSWLNANHSTPKRLRVLETVTLGDKRLVAVIQAEGRRFLVGGGPSGVSLLTPLDHERNLYDDFEPAGGLTELAG